MVVFKLNVMTFNIRHGRGLDGKVNLQRIVEVIKQEHIDIVTLNEVDRMFSIRSNFVDQSSWLANELKMDFVFGPALSLKRGDYGNAILSKLPIIKHENYIFRLKPPVAEPRAILEATISVDNSFISLLTSHFSIHPILHRKQLQFFLEYSSYPCILMGDLNRGQNSRSYRKLTGKYHDCSLNNPLPTYPARGPRSRLDFIFVSKHFDVLQTRVIQSHASDHLPVVAQLAKKS